MVGNVIGAVVVSAELKVDSHQLVVAVIRGRGGVGVAETAQDVAALQVIVAEHNGRVDLRKDLAEKRRSKT